MKAPQLVSLPRKKPHKWKKKKKTEMLNPPAKSKRRKTCDQKAHANRTGGVRRRREGEGANAWRSHSGEMRGVVDACPKAGFRTTPGAVRTETARWERPRALLHSCSSEHTKSHPGLRRKPPSPAGPRESSACAGGTGTFQHSPMQAERRVLRAAPATPRGWHVS